MRSTAPRDTMMAGRVPQIDGLRAQGMLMVYFFHIWEFGGKPSVPLAGGRADLIGFFRNFATGVDLFMVISGFCLFWPLCKGAEAARTWDVARYFKHRVRRIVPPYYAAIGYAVVLPMVLVAIYRCLRIPANWQPIPSTWELFTHFLFIHSMFAGTWNGITGAFWSLGLEAQFYVMFPLAVYAFRKAGVKAIWWMIAGSVAFRIVCGVVVRSPDLGFVLSISCLGRWMEFGAGMLTALAVASYWREGRTNSAATGTAQITGALVLYGLGVHADAVPALWILPPREVLLSGSFALLVFALCTSRTPLVKVYRSGVAVWLGGISYSLYLIHQPTAWYLSEFNKKALHVHGSVDFCLLATVGLSVVIAGGYVFYLIFEKPGIRSRSREKDAVAASGVIAAPVEEPALGYSTPNLPM